jgi:hypothetical protein
MVTVCGPYVTSGLNRATVKLPDNTWFTTRHFNAGEDANNAGYDVMTEAQSLEFPKYPDPNIATNVPTGPLVGLIVKVVWTRNCATDESN